MNTHPAVALVHKVVGVAQRHVPVGCTVLRDVADVVSGARVRVSIGTAKVEFEAVALVRHQVGVAVRRLAFDELCLCAKVRWHAKTVTKRGRTVCPSTSATGLAATRPTAAAAKRAKWVEKNIVVYDIYT
jgi:hypothetical protein